MKILVVYDSVYGNTEKIARAMGTAGTDDVKVRRAGETDTGELEGIDILIVGSPTQGFRAIKPVQDFLGKIPGKALTGKAVAAFDTRISGGEAGRGLRLLMKVGGYAAPRIAQALEKKGGKLIVPPEGFFVKDSEGPLLDGEEERAAGWVKEITEQQP